MSDIKNIPKSLNVQVFFKPKSMDPLFFDGIANHVAFTPLFFTLVSKHSTNSPMPLLSSEWSSDNDFKKWKFKIRKNLYFSNGDLITPQDVEQSIKRMAFLQKIRKSKSGFTEFLLGIEQIRNLSDNLSGITSDEDYIYFNFSKPIQNLVDKIGFGLYSVVHPSNYHHSDGSWLKHTNAVTSGFYKVSSWNEEVLLLELENNNIKQFLGDFQKDFVSQIRIKFNSQNSDQFDVVIGGSIREDLKNTHSFMGPSPSSILYVEWILKNQKNHPLEDINFRKSARSKFYQEMERAGIQYSQKFLSSLIDKTPEINPTYSTSSLDETFSTTEVKTVKMKDLSYAPHFLKFQSVIELSLKSLNIKLENIVLNQASKSGLDGFISATSILLDDPDDDIRFMFLSKEGIQLPDLDGSIHQELKKEKLDYQKINELIWEQALVWPITHYSFGIWTKPNIDTSLLNPLAPPTDLSLIRFKE